MGWYRARGACGYLEAMLPRDWQANATRTQRMCYFQCSPDDVLTMFQDNSDVLSHVCHYRTVASHLEGHLRPRMAFSLLSTYDDRQATWYLFFSHKLIVTMLYASKITTTALLTVER